MIANNIALCKKWTSCSAASVINLLMENKDKTWLMWSHCTLIVLFKVVNSCNKQNCLQYCPTPFWCDRKPCAQIYCIKRTKKQIWDDQFLFISVYDSQSCETMHFKWPGIIWIDFLMLTAPQRDLFHRFTVLLSVLKSH